MKFRFRLLPLLIDVLMIVYIIYILMHLNPSLRPLLQYYVRLGAWYMRQYARYALSEPWAREVIKTRGYLHR